MRVTFVGSLLARRVHPLGMPGESRYNGEVMTLDDDDKTWVRGEIAVARTELREEIAGVRQGLNDLRGEVRGGFEGMARAFATMAVSLATLSDKVATMSDNMGTMSTKIDAMSSTLTTAIETQTRTLVDAIVRERVQALIAPTGNGKPPKGGGEKT